MTRLGASSPPRVRAVPVKCDGAGSGSSEGGGWALSDCQILDMKLPGNAREYSPAGLFENLLLEIIWVLYSQSRLLTTRKEIVVVAIIAIRRFASSSSTLGEVS